MKGCVDNNVRRYDNRAGKTAVSTINLRGAGSVTSIAASEDGSFLMAGSGNYTVTSLHLPSSSVVASKSTPFLPRAICFASSAFYCGGSDRQSLQTERDLTVLDFQCRAYGNGSTPVSSRSIYAIAIHPTNGCMAAGGYFPGKEQMESAGEVIDVYCVPPVRSYSFTV